MNSLQIQLQMKSVAVVRDCRSQRLSLQLSQQGIVGEIPHFKCSHVCFCAKWAHSADLLEKDQWDPLLRPLLPFSSDSTQTMNNKLIKPMTAWRRESRLFHQTLTTDTELEAKALKNTDKQFG